MSYLDSLRALADAKNSIVCMGMDPVLDKIPIKKDLKNSITEFYSEILDACISEDCVPPTVKPNIAFYEQYGFEGLQALKNVIEMAKEAGSSVILDAKRGDIGKTSDAYARSVFDFWKVDAVTVQPYLGIDSVGSFLEHPDKGVYVLARTSNKSAVELQDLEVNGKKVYQKVSELLLKWYKPGLSAVVGATYPKELKEISSFFVDSNIHIPFLIPGVGTQGGSAKEVVKALKSTNNPLWLHRINSSSGINYAYLKQDTDDYAGAAAKAIKNLNREIGPI